MRYLSAGAFTALGLSRDDDFIAAAGWPWSGFRGLMRNYGFGLLKLVLGIFLYGVMKGFFLAYSGKFWVV